jgi:ABC-type phosphate transport system permease subunit
MSTEYKETILIQSADEKEKTRKPVQSILEVLPGRIISILLLITSVVIVVVGFLSISLLTLEDYPVPLLAIFSFLMLVCFIDIYRQNGKWDFRLLALGVSSFAALMALRSLPILWTGWQINAFIDHSVFSAIFLLLLGTFGMMVSLYYALGATPAAEDISYYPLILLPVFFILFVYVFLLGKMWEKGIANFDLKWILAPYLNNDKPLLVYLAGDWPHWTTTNIKQPGLLNHLLGTGLLMLLTTLISLPIGVGAGIYLNEYGDNRFGRLARSLISSLRAVSLFIIGLTAFSIVFYSNNTPFSQITHGFWTDGHNILQISTGGSYLTASLVLSLLVIPLITSATEQGCRSLPSELREGSLALGASENTTLRRVILPWALPNIVTSVILGCAEAAGSVAVLLFIAGRGVNGVGIFKQVTSLAYLIFDLYYASPDFKNMMGGFQYTAGILLLLINFTLGILAMVSKRLLIHRFRGE